jgi:hypothetical protein
VKRGWFCADVREGLRVRLVKRVGGAGGAVTWYRLLKKWEGI